MSFIPVDFYSLESIFGQLSVIQIKNLSIGIFLNDNPQEDLYIDLNNINRIFPDSVTNLQPLFSFLHKIEDRESFSVYKLEVDFGTFHLNILKRLRFSKYMKLTDKRFWIVIIL